MELTKIEDLIQKYHEAATSIAEEKTLQLYFSSSNVAQHLQHYQVIFGYYKHAKQEKFETKLILQTKKKTTTWLSIAATIIIMYGVGVFFTVHKSQTVYVTELGTFNNPEMALKETQKALAILSNHLNSGIESVNYVTEYQKSKDRIFN